MSAMTTVLVMFIAALSGVLAQKDLSTVTVSIHPPSQCRCITYMTVIMLLTPPYRPPEVRFYREIYKENAHGALL